MDDIKTIYNPIKVDDDYFAFHENEQNELYAKMKTISETIIDILFGQNTPKIIMNICQNYQLNYKQSEELSRLIRKILVAEIYLGDIISEIAGRLQIGENIARELANKLIADLFANALEDIKKLHREKFGASITGQVATSKIPIPPLDPPVTQHQEEKEKMNPNNVLDLRK